MSCKTNVDLIFFVYLSFEKEMHKKLTFINIIANIIFNDSGLLI